MIFITKHAACLSCLNISYIHLYIRVARFSFLSSHLDSLMKLIFLAEKQFLKFHLLRETILKVKGLFYRTNVHFPMNIDYKVFPKSPYVFKKLLPSSQITIILYHRVFLTREKRVVSAVFTLMSIQWSLTTKFCFAFSFSPLLKACSERILVMQNRVLCVAVREMYLIEN